LVKGGGECVPPLSDIPGICVIYISEPQSCRGSCWRSRPWRAFRPTRRRPTSSSPCPASGKGEQREIDSTATERGYYCIYTAGDCYVNVKLACTSARQQKLSLLQGCILPIHLEQDLNNIAWLVLQSLKIPNLLQGWIDVDLLQAWIDVDLLQGWIDVDLLQVWIMAEPVAVFDTALSCCRAG